MAIEISVEETSVAPSWGFTSPVVDQMRGLHRHGGGEDPEFCRRHGGSVGQRAAAQKWGSPATAGCGYRYRGVT
jgi:hypothetical protein